MKPIFIYKYEKNMQKKSKQFFDLFMRNGEDIEQEFTREGMDKRDLREDGLKMVHFQDDHHSNSGSLIHGSVKANSNAGFSNISRTFTKTKRRI